MQIYITSDATHATLASTKVTDNSASSIPMNQIPQPLIDISHKIRHSNPKKIRGKRNIKSTATQQKEFVLEDGVQPQEILRETKLERSTLKINGMPDIDLSNHPIAKSLKTDLKNGNAINMFNADGQLILMKNHVTDNTIYIRNQDGTWEKIGLNPKWGSRTQHTTPITSELVKINGQPYVIWAEVNAYDISDGFPCNGNWGHNDQVAVKLYMIEIAQKAKIITLHQMSFKYNDNDKYCGNEDNVDEDFPFENVEIHQKPNVNVQLSFQNDKNGGYGFEWYYKYKIMRFLELNPEELQDLINGKHIQKNPTELAMPFYKPGSKTEEMHISNAHLLQKQEGASTNNYVVFKERNTGQIYIRGPETTQDESGTYHKIKKLNFQSVEDFRWSKNGNFVIIGKKTKGNLTQVTIDDKYKLRAVENFAQWKNGNQLQLTLLHQQHQKLPHQDL